MTDRTEPLVDRPPGAVLFHRGPHPVTAEAFLHDVRALAAALPDAGWVVNLCRDRYAFAVAFVAAVLRGQVSLLTGDHAPQSLAGLAKRFPGAYAALDEATEVPLPTFVVGPLNEAAHGHGSGLVVPLTPPSATIPRAITRGALGIYAPSRGERALIPCSRLVAIVFTSGSTGTPVAHRKLWGALADRSRAAGEQFGLNEAAPSTVVGTVPPHHMYGFELTVLLPLHAAASSWCGPAFFPGDVHAALLATDAPRVLVTTPLQIRALLHADGGLPPLAAAISATAPLEPALAAVAEARWHAPMLEIFGATEVGSIASRRTLDGDAWTVYPGVAITQGEDVAVVAAPHAEPQALADRIEMLDGLHFRLLVRRTDLVKLGGRRASLSGLNRILNGLDGVADGTFVVPDDLEQRSTARLLAVVVAPRRTPGSILAELRGQVDPLFLPRRVICVDRLPRNELGKLPRQALLALVAEYDPSYNTVA